MGHNFPIRNVRMMTRGFYSPFWGFVLGGLVVCIAAVFMGLPVALGRAIPHYAAPDERAWAAGLIQPDAPTSCCGPADAYWADRTEPCSAADLLAMPKCALVAIVDDPRPPEDFTPMRPALAPGTRVLVPQSKIRKPPSYNPTGHNIVFLNVWSASVGETPTVYCWEPLAQF